MQSEFEVREQCVVTENNSKCFLVIFLTLTRE